MGAGKLDEKYASRLNGGHYNLQLIKPYLARNYDAKEPPWLRHFRTYQGTQLTLPSDGGDGDGDDNEDEMVSILKKDSSYLALSTHEIWPSWTSAMTCQLVGSAMPSISGPMAGPPAREGNLSFPMNMWMIWCGCAIPCHPIRPFTLHCAA